EGLDHLFPTASELARVAVADLAAIGLPTARATALSTLAREVDAGRLDLDPPADPEELVRALVALPGFGAWTASYVAMRALGWPDAFLEGDLVIRKALGGVTPRAARSRAEAWRPWRAYAAL